MVEDRWLSVDEIALYLGVERDAPCTSGSTAIRCLPTRCGASGNFRKDAVDQWVRRVCSGHRDVSGVGT